METRFDMNEWGKISGQLRDKYPELNSADLYWGRVSREDLIEMISTKLGKTKKDLIDVIESF
jgi:hypothetical protein